MILLNRNFYSLRGNKPDLKFVIAICFFYLFWLQKSLSPVKPIVIMQGFIDHKIDTDAL